MADNQLTVSEQNEQSDNKKGFNRILHFVLKLPGIRINREKFLGRVLKRYKYSDEIIKKIIEDGIDSINLPDKDKIVASIISRQKWRATITSFFVGLPGGLFLILTIPIDILQYYIHLIVVAQKVAYLYGYEQFNESQEYMNHLFALLRSMIGIASGSKAFKIAVKEVSTKALKKIPAKIVEKAAATTIVKNVSSHSVGRLLAKYCSKQFFSKILGKIVPFIGGFISGTITKTTFTIECKRLEEKLREIDLDEELNSIIDDIIKDNKLSEEEFKLLQDEFEERNWNIKDYLNELDAVFQRKLANRGKNADNFNIYWDTYRYKIENETKTDNLTEDKLSVVFDNDFEDLLCAIIMDGKIDKNEMAELAAECQKNNISLQDMGVMLEERLELIDKSKLHRFHSSWNARLKEYEKKHKNDS